MSIETLKAQLEQAKLEAQASISTAIESAKIELEIKKVTSPLYHKRQVQNNDIAKLDAMISHIEEIYAGNKRKISQYFNYGLVPNKIMTIANAIMYTKSDEKLELLMMSGLDETTIEELLESFGNTAYFSKASLTVVDEIPMDIVKTKQLVQLCADDLGLVSDINMSKFNQDNIDYVSVSALARAEESLENTLKYNADAAVEYTE